MDGIGQATAQQVPQIIGQIERLAKIRASLWEELKILDQKLAMVSRGVPPQPTGRETPPKLPLVGVAQVISDSCDDLEKCYHFVDDMISRLEL